MANKGGALSTNAYILCRVKIVVFNRFIEFFCKNIDHNKRINKYKENQDSRNFSVYSFVLRSLVVESGQRVAEQLKHIKHSFIHVLLLKLYP